MGTVAKVSTIGDLALSCLVIGNKVGELLPVAIKLRCKKPQLKVAKKDCNLADPKIPMKFILGILNAAIAFAEMASFSLSACVSAKMMKNEIKYPITAQVNESSDRIIPKWTELQSDGPSADPCEATKYIKKAIKTASLGYMREREMILGHCSEQIAIFAAERNWTNKYTPNQVCLSILAELGELCNHLEWKDQDARIETMSECTMLGIAEELADVIIYLMHIKRELA